MLDPRPFRSSCALALLFALVLLRSSVAVADDGAIARPIKPILPGVTSFARAEIEPRLLLAPRHPKGLTPDRPLALPAQRETRPEAQRAFETFTDRAGGNWTVSWDAFTGALASLVGGPGPELGPDVAAGARALLVEHARLFGIVSENQLAPPRITSRPSATIVSFPMRVGGVPVTGAAITVVTDTAGRLLAISGSFPVDVSVGAAPALAPEHALSTVLARIGGGFGIGAAMAPEFADPDFSRARRLVLRDDTIAPAGSVPVGILANSWALDGDTLRPAWVVAIGIREGFREIEAVVDAADGQVLASRFLNQRAEAINVYAVNPDQGPIVAREIDAGDKPNPGGPLDGRWTSVTNGTVPRIAGAPYNHTTNPDDPTVDRNFDEQMAFWHGSRANRYFRALEGDDILGARNYATEPVLLNVQDPDPLVGNYARLFDRITVGAGTYHTDPVYGGRDFALEEHFWLHEYAHRVTFDVADWLSQDAALAMSEGLSDYFAMSYTNDKYIGAFQTPGPEYGDESGLVGGFNGFTRSAENPRTYSDICDNFYADPATATCRPAPDNYLCCEEHSDGEIYTAALWDMRRSFIAAEGYADGVAKSDQIAFDHLYALATGAQDFIRGRDQLLAADASLYGGAHECLIWQAFAGRELGVGANNALPVPVTSTALPAQCQNVAEVRFNQGSFNCGSGQRGRVTVTDANGGTASSITVTTRSGDSETFPLTWSGGSAQTALFDIRSGAPGPNNGAIEVSGAGDTLRATFQDNAPARTVTAGADIDCRIDLRVKSFQIENGTCDGADPFLDAGETATLVVTLQNRETGGTLEGAQLTLGSGNAKVTVNAPATQVVTGVAPGGDVVLRFSVTASASASGQESIAYTLTGGGPAYPGGMDAISFSDTLEADLLEVPQSKSWTFTTAPQTRPAGATYPNGSCQNPNRGPDDWCTIGEGQSGTETFNWYNVACTAVRPFPLPSAGYWLQGSSLSTACSGTSRWAPRYSAGDYSWLVSPTVRFQAPDARFPSRLDRVEWKHNVELGPEAAVALFIQGDQVYRSRQIVQASTPVTAANNTSYGTSGGWVAPDTDQDGTAGQSLIQTGRFGSDLDLRNGRVKLRFLFAGRDGTPPDPTVTGQDGYYVDDVVLRWVEKRPGTDAAVSCAARDATLRYASLYADDTNPSGGNGNGQVDPNETVVLNVRLAGAGTDSSRGITGTLTTDQPAYVTILDGNASWPDTASGQVQLSSAPHLKVAVSPSVPCGTVIEMTLTLDHNGSSAKSVVKFPLRIGAFGPAATPAIKEDFEAGPGGWTRNVSGTDTATDGLWEWAVPRLTCYYEGSGNPPSAPNCTDYKTTQPGTDANPGTSSGHAWITENGTAGSAFSSHDTDSGETSIQSGNYDLTTIADPIVSYARHYYSREGFPVDSLDIAISTDGGSTWTDLETYAALYGIVKPGGSLSPDDGPLDGGWVRSTFNLRDLGIVPTATTAFRVKVRDLATEGLSGQIVEAGFDDLQIHDNVGGSCAPFTPSSGQAPGEAARLAAQQMRVTAYNRTTGDVTVSYGVACDATGHHVVHGPLTAVSTYGYSGQACGLGATGTATFNPGSGSRFWLIVGEGSGKEGSYGRGSNGTERPEATGLPGGCDYPQDLNAACQ